METPNTRPTMVSLCVLSWFGKLLGSHHQSWWQQFPDLCCSYLWRLATWGALSSCTQISVYKYSHSSFGFIWDLFFLRNGKWDSCKTLCVSGVGVGGYSGPKPGSPACQASALTNELHLQCRIFYISSDNESWWRLTVLLPSFLSSHNGEEQRKKKKKWNQINKIFRGFDFFSTSFLWCLVCLILEILLY